jgi:hypothetical protein
VGGNDFAAAGGGAAEIGAQPGGPAFGRHLMRIAQHKTDFISHEPHKAVAGSRSHDRFGLFHLEKDLTGSDCQRNGKNAGPTENIVSSETKRQPAEMGTLWPSNCPTTAAA